MAGGKSGRRGRLALVVLLFGGILAAGRLVPAVRWFFRQRADRVAEEVGRRGIELPTFKLTRRRALIYRLTHDPELLEAAEVYARENGISVAVAMARVERYAREIVPSFNAFLYFRIGIPLAGWISKSLYDIRVGSERGLAALDENVVEDVSVIFVMNHRRNIDYVLLAHLMAPSCRPELRGGGVGVRLAFGTTDRWHGRLLRTAWFWGRPLQAGAGALCPDGRRGWPYTGLLPRGWTEQGWEAARAEGGATRLRTEAFRP